MRTLCLLQHALELSIHLPNEIVNNSCESQMYSGNTSIHYLKVVDQVIGQHFKINSQHNEDFGNALIIFLKVLLPSYQPTLLGQSSHIGHLLVIIWMDTDPSTYKHLLQGIVCGIHIYGTSLGGFLAQLFAQYRPRRVRSLILSNTFLDTRSFSAAMPWAPIVSWSPSFLLKRYVLTGIRSGPHEPFIADSVDFIVSQVETLSKDDLASRLTLTVDSASVGPLLLTDAYITIMDTNDYCAIPQDCKDEVGERYPGARQADLKTGGDFPFLSRPDEVNLHLQLHLRRVGVEPRPDLVPSAAEDSCHDQIEIHESIIEREYKQDDLTEPFETGCAGTSKNDKGEVKEPPPKEPSDDEGDEEDVHEIKEDPLKKSSDSEDQQQEDDPGSSRSPLKGSVGEDDGDVSNHSPLNNRENDTGSIPTQDNHMREESRHPLPDTSLKIS